MESASPMARGVPPHIFEQMVTFRRDLHHHPELSGKEQRTADRRRRTRRCGRHQRHRSERRIGRDSRGDMDALAVREETGLPFASCRVHLTHTYANHKSNNQCGNDRTSATSPATVSPAHDHRPRAATSMT